MVAAPKTTTKLPNADSREDVAIDQQSRSALVNARRNLNYISNPSQVSAAERPARLRTRALLRTVRYISQFVIWRLVRWAKYAAVGALVAAIGASAVGGLVTGAAWVIAPPSIGASIIAASVWGIGKFAARRLHVRWKSSGEDKGEAARESQSDHRTAREDNFGSQVGPPALPW